jgi:hypothetical protein
MGRLGAPGPSTASQIVFDDWFSGSETSIR